MPRGHAKKNTLMEFDRAFCAFARMISSDGVCFAPEALSLAPIEIGAVMSVVLVQMLFNSQMLTVVGEYEC